MKDNGVKPRFAVCKLAGHGVVPGRSALLVLLIAWLSILTAPLATAQTGQPGFHESVVFNGLDSPTAFQFASDGRVFVAEKSGLILVYDSLTSNTPIVFADLRSQVDSTGSRGLLGMALAPGFPSVPYVYILYNYNASPGGGHLSRLQASGDVMTGTEQVLIQDWYEHYPDQPVGNLEFGPDGALYAGGGDGASASFVDLGQTDNPSPDPPNEGGALRSQDLRTPGDPVTLDGSIIRVQPDTGLPLREDTSMTVSGPTIDGNGVKSYTVMSVFQGNVPQTVRVLEPTNPAPGRPRRFLYVLPVEAGVTNRGSTWGDGLEELRLLDVPNRFNLTLIAPSFNYEPWYGDNVNDPTSRMESFIVRDLVPFGDRFAPDGQIPQRFVVGFSKSGNGALLLVLRHPNVFSAAAAWDCPAQLSSLSAYTALPMNFGTQDNFNQYVIPTLVSANGAAFTSSNRLWISGDDAIFTADMMQLHDQLSQASIPHTWVHGGHREHNWSSGWLDGAITGLDANASQLAPADANEQRIIASGLRSPRLTFRPGTSELWVADRGWNTTEEIDRIPDATDGIVENFGWPCYEGNSVTQYSTSSICSLLYSQPATVTALTVPFYEYDHQEEVAGGDQDPLGTGAISGLAFYGSGNYPSYYQGALFFSDYLRNHIWVMFKGASGLPDPSTRTSFLAGAASPVDLKTGPGGDLFYADRNGGTIRRITYTPQGDNTPPSRSNGQPTGSLASGTTQTTLSLTTDENASCRYATTAGLAFASMPNTFGVTGGMAHSTTVTGLSDGGSYNYYVRCQDVSGNANPDDYPITFTVSNSGSTTSNFMGVENPLSEGGMWDKPGSWGPLQKNNGVFATGGWGGARLARPTAGADQYGEITYDQDPGSSSWVGVMTRVQGPNNGSGYLAIVFAGQVRLYRTDDTGSLNFTLLAAANAPVGTAPRLLRMESQGSTQRVYFNGTLLINFSDGTYGSGQPGIAAFVSNGPLIKIQSFAGGTLSSGSTTSNFTGVENPLSEGGMWDKPGSWGPLQKNNGVFATGWLNGARLASMPNTFGVTGGMAHSTTVTGLSDGGSYSYYVRCQDVSGNASPDDYVIGFTVSSSGSTTSNFTGVENPLSEGGMWDKPGSWGPLQKNNGVFATGWLNGARLARPALGADQYGEITYDQDPGSSSWVAVMTRVQGPNNGSGYLAIVFAGQVRLYRTDDTGSLNFTLLAAADAPVGTAPRLLRMESQGSTQRVYFNGTLLINFSDGTYGSGQPGIAAFVSNGPLIKIQTFAGGSLP